LAQALALSLQSDRSWMGNGKPRGEVTLGRVFQEGVVATPHAR